MVEIANENVLILTFAALRLECAVLGVAAHSNRAAGTCSSMRPLVMDLCLLDAFRAVVEAIVVAASAASYLFQCRILFLLLLPAKKTQKNRISI